MQHKSFREMSCPIARSLDRVGEWWSILIMRDALFGLRRFDEFQKSLGIAPNMLARRLNALVKAGLLERRRYSARPPRNEYRPTERGRDFRPVLIALLAFGNRHFAPEGASVTIVDAQTGAEAEPVVVDRATGRPIREPEFAWVPGPAAGERTRQRYARRPQSEQPLPAGERLECAHLARLPGEGAAAPAAGPAPPSPGSRKRAPTSPRRGEVARRRP
jgi:DNA-binding HxlR family transcriptional regulator